MAHPFRQLTPGGSRVAFAPRAATNELSRLTGPYDGGRRQRSAPRGRSQSDRKVLFETLEPRYLLSADIMPWAVDMADAGSDLTLRVDDLTNSLQLIDNLDAGGPAVIDERLLDDTTSVRFTGTDQDDRVTLDFDTRNALAFGISFAGGLGVDTLAGDDSDNDWSIGVSGAGSFGGVTFTAIESLFGGAGADVFSFAEGAFVSGMIDGGGGTNTLDYGAATTDVSVDLAAGRASGTGGISSIQNVTGGGGGDTLKGDSGANVLSGGGGDDVLSGGGGLDSVLGGAGSDTLVAGDGANLWRILGPDSGTLNDLSFAEIENLTGGAGADTFVFLPDGSISGVIVGGGGVDRLDYSAQSAGVSVNLALEQAGLTGAVREVEDVTGGAGADSLIGDAGANVLSGGLGNDLLSGGGGADTLSGGDGSDTLAGPVGDASWLISGLDAGLVGSVGFVGIENLLGGAGADSFVLADGAGITGTIDGGEGDDTLDYSDNATVVLVNLAVGMASRTGTVRGIENVIGGRNRDTLIGDGHANRLSGGEGDDLLSGGGGADILAGGAGSDTLMGPADNATWIITGRNQGNVAGVSFSGIENLTGAADNDDTFIIAPGGSVDGVVDGGDAGFDTIVIEDGGYSQLIFTATGADSGSISLDGTVIEYDGLEPVDTTGTVGADLVFNLPGADDRVELVDLGGGNFRLQSTGAIPTFEQHDFADPGVSGSVTINLGVGRDSIILPDLSGLDAALTVNGDAGDDTIIVSGDSDVTIADASLTQDGVTASIDDFQDAVLIASTSDTVLDSSGFSGNSSTVSSLNEVIDTLLEFRFDPDAAPTAADTIFTSTDTLVPDDIVVGRNPGAAEDLRLGDVTLTFQSGLDFSGGSWVGNVGVEAVSGTLYPGLLDIVINDDNVDGDDADDDADLFAVVGVIDLTVGTPAVLSLDDLEAEDIGWPAFLEIKIDELELKFDDFRGNDTDNSLELDAAFLGIDTGNDALNDLLSADNPLFGLSVTGGVFDLGLDMDAIGQGVRNLADGKISFPNSPITNLGGVAGAISGKLFGVGSVSAGFILAEVMADPDGPGPLPEASALYVAVEGSLSLGDAITGGGNGGGGNGGGGDGGGIASFGLAFAFSELGPLQFFVSSDVTIPLEPTTGLAISGLRAGVRFNTTIEGLQTETDFMAEAASFDDTTDRVTLTIPEHDLAIGNDFRVIGISDDDPFAGEFEVLSVNGDQVIYEVEEDPGLFVGSRDIIRLTITDPLDLRDEGLQSGVAPPDNILVWKSQLDQAVTNQIEAGDDVWALLFEQVVIGGGASLSFDPRIPDTLLQFEVDFLLDTELRILLVGKSSLLDGFVELPTRMFADLSDLFSGNGRFLYLSDVPDFPVDLDPLLVYRGEVSFETIIGFDVLGATVSQNTASGFFDVELELALDDPSSEFLVGGNAPVFDSDPGTFDGIYEVIGVDDTLNTVTLQYDIDPGDWIGGSVVVPKQGFRIELEGGIDLNIPGLDASLQPITLTTLTLEGGTGLEFAFPVTTVEEEPDLVMTLDFAASLSETTFGTIGIANGVFRASLDVDPVLQGDLPIIEVWGAALLDTDFAFLEPVGLFADAEGLLRINSSDQERPAEMLIDAGGDVVLVELPADSFALRLDGSVEFRVDDTDFFNISGIFVLEFSGDQGFNVAVFDVDDVGDIDAATLSLGPAGSALLQVDVQGFFAIRTSGFALSFVLNLDAGLLDLARLEGLAVFVVNTTGEDLSFDIPGGADPNRPDDLSLVIPRAAPVDTRAFFDSVTVDDLVDGQVWDLAPAAPPAVYGVMFLSGGLLLNIPGTTTLTLGGKLAIDFAFPLPVSRPPEDPDLVINFSFSVGLSETNFGSIGDANGAFHAAIDFDPITQFLPPVIDIWGAALLTTNFGFLEPLGLFATADSLLRINFTDTDRTETLRDINSNLITVELPAESFALRLDGGIEFQIGGASVFQIGGIFVLEFAADQGFNVAIFDDRGGTVGPATLRLGAPSSPLFEVDVLGFLAVRADGFATSLVLNLEAGLPLGLASIDASAVFVVNTTGRLVRFDIPGGGTDPNAPPELSLMIPAAAPANPSLILGSPGPGPDPAFEALKMGDLSWLEGPVGPYAIVFVKGELELLSILNFEVSGFVSLGPVSSLEVNFFAGGNFLNLVSGSASGTLFFSSEGEFLLDVGANVQLGPTGFNISGSADLVISFLDENGTASGGTGPKVLDVAGSLRVQGTIFFIPLPAATVGVSYNSASGDISISVGPVPVPFIDWACFGTIFGRVCIPYPNVELRSLSFTIGNLQAIPTPPPPVTLGQVDGNGVLTLNVGPDADKRNLLEDEVKEEVVIDRVGAGSQRGDKIEIAMFGVTQIFDNVTDILIADMGEGDDFVEILPAVTTSVEVNFGAGRDRLRSAGSGVVVAYGGGGNDRLEGGSGNDRLFGGSDNDFVSGGAGQDWIEGGDDEDTLIGGDDGDTIKGGGGVDLIAGDQADIQGSATTSVLRTIASADGGNDIIEGGDGADIILGGSGNDILTGGAGQDRLFGDDGEVTISDQSPATIALLNLAFSGNDQVIWEVGDADDIIEGQAGTDTLGIFGTNSVEHVTVNAAGTGFTADIGAEALGVDGVEISNIEGRGGSDSFTINDLSTSLLRQINLRLGVDGAQDAAVINGSSGGDVFDVTPIGDFLRVQKTGGVTVDIYDAGPASGGDTITLNTFAGADIVNVRGTRAGTFTTVNTGDDHDTVNVQAIGAAATVDAGSGSDTINVGSLSPATGGTVDGIAALLTVNGNEPTGGSDVLNVDDTGDTAPNTGLLTATTITGLGMAGSIAYGTIETLNIGLGSGGDTFTIADTHTGTTRLDTNGGDDTVNVLTTAGATEVNTGADHDTVNVQAIGAAATFNAGSGSDTINVGSLSPATGGTVDGIVALLTINGNDPTSGSDVLNVDDTGDTAPNTGLLTATTITGLGMAGSIAYGTIETLNIGLGSGGDTFTIADTHTGTTRLDTNGGDDTVNVLTTAGATEVNTGADHDTVNVRTIGAPTEINAGAGDDVITVGTLAPMIGGTLNAIGAPLIANGDEGDDTLIVDDSGDTTDNSGTLMPTMILGLGMSDGITYETFEVLDLLLGSGRTDLTIEGTHGGETNIAFGAGDDTVNVKATGGPVKLDLLGGDDTVNIGSLAPRFGGTLNGIGGLLSILGGAGFDLVNVDDTGDAGPNIGTLDADSLTGLGMAAGLRYETIEQLEISLGSGPDDLSVVGTMKGTDGFHRVTLVNTGGGDDTVDVSLLADTDGFFALNAEAGNDWVDATHSTLPLVIFGGDGGDTIQGGQGRDIVFGDRGRVDYRDDTGRLITRLGIGLAERTVLGPNDSEQSITDVPLRQTDGVERSPVLIATRISANDGDDTIEESGTSDFDTLFGGLGNDTITDNGGHTIVIGDYGMVAQAGGVIAEIATTDPDEGGGNDTIVSAADADAILGGLGNDTITDHGGDNILIGDNGKIEFTATGAVSQITTTDPAAGDGHDTITSAVGADLILGGSGNDWIDAGADASPDIVVGDNGTATYQSGLLVEIQTTDPAFGGNDTIFGGSGPDAILGGSNAPAAPLSESGPAVPGDILMAGGTDDAEDIVIGDNGRLTFGGTGLFDDGEQTATLSFNFNASSGSRTVTGVAGAEGARAGNWNNLVGDGPQTFGDESGEIVLFDDGQIAPGVTIRWGEDLDTDPDDLSTDSHSQITPDDDQDLRLFEGYLHTSTSHTVGVEIAGLAGHFRIYDLYVYLDADDGKSSSGTDSVRSITDGLTTYYLNDPDGNTFTGTYVQVESTDPSAPEAGNYVVFTGLTADEATIRIDDVGMLSSNRPAITAVQVVGQSHPIDRVESTDWMYGGADTILTGGGADIAIGGRGTDIIDTSGPSVRGVADADIVAGDNARGTFMLGELRELRTTGAGSGDGDIIRTGNGEDIVLGGDGGDDIGTGTEQPFDLGDIQVLSVNFNGGVDKGVVTGVAGAVQVGNWNNVVAESPGDDDDDDRGPSQIVGDLVFDDGTDADGVTVEVGRNLDGLSSAADRDSHSQIDNPDTQNARLFEGYLHNSTARTLGVDLNGLAAHFESDSYDVYVYLDADDNRSRSGTSVRRISDGTTAFYLNDADGNTYAGEFIEVDSTDPTAPGVGNYVVFRNLTGDAVSIRIDDDGTLLASSSNRPAITAIQVVGGADKDSVVDVGANQVGGDFDIDAVVGDNGIARLFGGALYELLATDPLAPGDDTITTGEGPDLAMGGSGADVIDGQAGHDLLLGDNARLILFGGEILGLDIDDGDDDDDPGFDPYDVLGIQLLNDGIGGDDTLIGGTDDDLMYGQFGDDTFAFVGGGLGEDRAVEAGNGDVRPNDLHDRLDFSAFIGPIDVDLGRSSMKTINGAHFEGDVNVRLQLFSGTAFEDVTGSAFDDEIEGNSRDNRLIGLAGDDDIRGESGDDLLLGGEGHDYIVGGSGDDLLDGGTGNDRLRGDGTDDDDDDGPRGVDVILGGDGDDDIRGGGGADLIDGEAGDDTIRGGSGNDVLLGGEGDDFVRGDSGADTLEGGAGIDNLNGGSGPDSVEQDTAAGQLGLLDVFRNFQLVFGHDGFFFVDPTSGDAMVDDRPPRAWVEDFLNSVPGNMPGALAATAAASAANDGAGTASAAAGAAPMLARVFDEELNAFVEVGEMKQLERIDGGLAAAGLSAEDDDLILIETPGDGPTSAGGTAVNWNDGFSGFGASP